MAAHEDPYVTYGQCKCCLKTTYLKNMWTPQESNGQWEVYGEMLVDCFSIDWTILSVEEDNICQVCISKLRVATAFKQQVEQSQASAKDPVEVVAAIEEVVSTERVQVEAIPSHDGKEVEVNFVPILPRKDNKTPLVLAKPPLIIEEKSSNTVPKKHIIETVVNKTPLENKKDRAQVINIPLENKKDAAKIMNTLLENQKDTAQVVNASLRNKKDTAQVVSASLNNKKDTAQEVNASLKNKKDTAQVVNASLKNKKDTAQVVNASLKNKKDSAQVNNTPLIEQNTTTLKNDNSSMSLKKEHEIPLIKAKDTPEKNIKINEENTTAISATESITRPVKKENIIAKPKNISLKEENTCKREMVTTVNIQSCGDTDDENINDSKRDDHDDEVFDDMEYLEEIKQDYQKKNDDEIYEDMEYLDEHYINDGEENESECEINDEENESECEINDEENESECEINDEENESECEINDEENESAINDINDSDYGDEDEDFEPEPKKRKSTNNSTTKGTDNRIVRRRSKRKIYTRDDLKQALEAVKTGKMSRREASNVFNVPRCKITEEDVQKLPEDDFTSQLLRATRAILTYTNATPFKVSGQGSYRCFFCGVKGPVFRHPDKLRQHTRQKHPDKVKQADAALRPRYLNQMVRFDIHKFKCDCSMQISWDNMLVHLKENHGITNIDEAWENIVPYNLITETDVIPCAFPSCGFSGCFSIMDSHMNKHYPNYLCGECGKPCVSEWRLRCHTTQFHQSGRFACNHCPKVFFSISSRNAHKESVHGTRFKCTICPEKFRTQKERNSHLKKEHEDMLESVGKYCNICGNYFWPNDFDRHLKLEHDGFKSNSSVKKFKCALCSKMFFKKEAVLTHIMDQHKN